MSFLEVEKVDFPSSVKRWLYLRAPPKQQPLSHMHSFIYDIPYKEKIKWQLKYRILSIGNHDKPRVCKEATLCWQCTDRIKHLLQQTGRRIVPFN